MINKDTKVVDVIEDSLFKGYGRLIFPTAFGRPSPSMTLSQAGSMLIYHNYVNTDTTLDVIRHMQKEAKAGRRIFYDIYTEAEKKRDPDKWDTGLFFFRGKPNAPFALVCAGGGFYYVGAIHESFPHALELSRRGYNGFALIYRTRTADTACEDLARAIRFIFEHKEELEVDTEGYSLGRLGRSQNGRLAGGLWTGSFRRRRAASGCRSDHAVHGAQPVQPTGSSNLCLCRRQGRHCGLAGHEETSGMPGNPGNRYRISSISRPAPWLRPGRGYQS